MSLCKVFKITDFGLRFTLDKAKFGKKKGRAHHSLALRNKSKASEHITVVVFTLDALKRN